MIEVKWGLLTNQYWLAAIFSAVRTRPATREFPKAACASRPIFSRDYWRFTNILVFILRSFSYDFAKLKSNNPITENNLLKNIIGKIQAFMCFQKIYVDKNAKFIYLSQDLYANLVSLEEWIIFLGIENGFSLLKSNMNAEIWFIHIFQHCHIIIGSRFRLKVSRVYSQQCNQCAGRIWFLLAAIFQVQRIKKIEKG